MMRMIQSMKAIINLMLIIDQDDDDDEGRKSSIPSVCLQKRVRRLISVVCGPPTCQHLAALFAPTKDFFAHEEFALVFN